MRPGLLAVVDRRGDVGGAGHRAVAGADDHVAALQALLAGVGRALRRSRPPRRGQLGRQVELAAAMPVVQRAERHARAPRGVRRPADGRGAQRRLAPPLVLPFGASSCLGRAAVPERTSIVRCLPSRMTSRCSDVAGRGPWRPRGSVRYELLTACAVDRRPRRRRHCTPALCGRAAGHQVGDDGALAAAQPEAVGHLGGEVLDRRADVAALDLAAGDQLLGDAVGDVGGDGEADADRAARRARRSPCSRRSPGHRCRRSGRRSCRG